MSCSHLLNNFNPRPPRGGRLITAAPPMQPITISIHAPREGGDGKRKPCYCGKVLFQSTPPARGATYLPVLDGFHAPLFQSTPPARGATTTEAKIFHAAPLFQSTPPARGATSRPCRQHMPRFISIHAPREGGDCSLPSGLTVARNFNPRPPRGGRRAVGAVPQSKEISIHAPREGGDAAGRSYIPHQAISIHAPREGGDHAGVLLISFAVNFNPRPPRGGRPSRRG